MEKKISKRVCSNSSQWRKSHGFHTERDAHFTLDEIIWEGRHNATPSSSTKEALVSELIVLGVGETTSPTSKESGPAIFTETRQAYPLQCTNFTFRNLSSKSTHAQRYTHDSVDLSTAHSSKSRGMPTEVQIHSWKVGTLEKKRAALMSPWAVPRSRPKCTACFLFPWKKSKRPVPPSREDTFLGGPAISAWRREQWEQALPRPPSGLCFMSMQ